MSLASAASTLHVESVGQGRTVVLLHGWALHGGLFAPLVAALARQHRVQAIDLPGHGHSAPLHPWTIDAVIAALEHRYRSEPAPLAVLGWSLGGVVALAWARRHPSRIRRLMLVGTTPKFIADASWPHALAPQTLARFAEELRVAYQATLLRFLSLQVQGSEAGRATLATLRHEMFARGEPQAQVLQEALRTLGAVDLRGEVGQIHQPALIVAGDRDTLAPLPALRWLADAMPCARLEVIRGAAHAPFLSHRAAFAALACRFLHDG